MTGTAQSSNVKFLVQANVNDGVADDDLYNVHGIRSADVISTAVDHANGTQSTAQTFSGGLTASGGLTVSGGNTTVTRANAAAVSVGPNGATNPTLVLDTSTASAATGVKVTSAAAASGVAVAVVSSGTNENLTVDAKGSGTITLNATGTGNVVLSRAATGVSLATTAGITSSGATSGVGYATGAGGAITQGTNRTTGVTVNTVTGAITLISAAGSATPASFTVTNSAVAATDVVIVNQKSGTDLYEIFVTAVAAGSFRITSFTTGGTTTEQPVFNFAVIKGVTS